MARLARLVIPGMPHHVTQRGNRRQQTFFNDGDYAAYLELMAEWCREEGVAVWGYCLLMPAQSMIRIHPGYQPKRLESGAPEAAQRSLAMRPSIMPNHTHLIAVPASEDGLRRAIGEAHRRYTRRINFREKWRRYLWQGRFSSFVMDEPYLLAAARYVELNPVRAGLVSSATEWRWSSAQAHLAGRDDCLAKVGLLLAMIDNWQGLLDSATSEEQLKELRGHGRTAGPLAMTLSWSDWRALSIAL